MNNTVHLNFSKIRCRAYCKTVLLGDKETAVRIRDNSHYRIFATRGKQVGMLIVL